MALERVEVINPQGVVTDLSPYELPNEVWTNGINVRFSGLGTKKVRGFSQVYPNLVIQPLAAFSWTDYDTSYWFYANETSIYRTEGTNQLDVTRSSSPYNTDILAGWSGGSFNGTLVMNNGTDAPQYFNTTSSLMEDLVGWPAATSCSVVRPYKNYLVALDVTKPSGRLPTLVKWSDSADPGAVPGSWDESDPATQAGENVLPDTAGACVEGKALNDTFFIYKTDSVWAMQFTGGNFVFSFRKVFNDVGALAKDCVVDFGGKHFVVGANDVYIHDGTTKQSVITNKIKQDLYSQLNPSYPKSIKAVADLANKEVLVYFASKDSDNGLSDRCLVWNWTTDTWSKRDLTPISFISIGDVSPQPDNQWDTDSEGWDIDTSPWGEGSYNPATTGVMLVDYTNSKFYKLNSSTKLNGADYTTIVERTGIDFGSDLKYKYVSTVTPHLVGEGTINIYIGVEDRQGQGVTWSDPVPFVIDQDYKADFRMSGRYISIKFESTFDNLWELSGYTIEFGVKGNR